MTEEKEDANDTLLTEGVEGLHRRQSRARKFESQPAPLWEPADESDATPDNPSSEPPLLDVAPWWRDPSTIPRREFLFGQHYIRRTIGTTIAAGGRGKTTLGLFEGVSMAIGRDLMTGETLPRGPLRVLCLNGEEDQDELDRRVAAICQRYEIAQSDLGGRLFVMSVRDRPLRLATLVQGAATLNRPAIEALTKLIEQNRIDVFMLDPWISFHAVNESGNMDMDLVIKEGLGGIATRTNSAGELFHHPGKPKPGQAETSVEDGRGASAILWAVRSARVLNFMTPDEASKLGIPEDNRRRHVRIANGKANMAPVGSAKWMRLEVQNLPNGDEVACSSPWSPPNPFDGVTTAQMELARQLARTGAYREDPRSPQWFGYAVAPILNIDVSVGADNKPGDVARIKAIIKTWCKNNVLETVMRKDEQRRERAFIVAGAFRPEHKPNPGADLADEEYTLQ
jgi:hypothetical protein